MNKSNEQTMNPTSKPNDLPVAGESASIESGLLKRIRSGGMPVAETESALLDLEPNGEIKGGPSGSTGYGGSTHLNHNETAAEDDTDEAELEDLPVSDEQEETVTGGPSGSGTYTGSTHLNHNETTVEDDVEAVELAELPVSDETEAEIKGGGGIYKLGSRRLILQGDGTYV